MEGGRQISAVRAMTPQKYFMPLKCISPKRRAELLTEVAMGNQDLLEFISREKDSPDFINYLNIIDNLEEAYKEVADAISTQGLTSVNILIGPTEMRRSKPEYKKLVDFAIQRARSKLEDELAKKRIIGHIKIAEGDAPA